MNKSFSRTDVRNLNFWFIKYTDSASVDLVKLTPKVAVPVYTKKLSVFGGGDSGTGTTD